MLIKVTNQCGMRCTHCMEGSVPRAPHMTLEMFERALDLTFRLECLAHSFGYKLVLLSGGECTENPEIVRMIQRVYDVGLQPILITNGMWLNNPELRSELLGRFPTLAVQVTNDPRFYPVAPPRVDDPRLIYVDSLSITVPMGRFTKQTHPDLPERNSPSSYNFRALTRATGDVRVAIATLRQRAVSGLSGHCAPSITHEGHFVAGEVRFCHKLGTVDSTVEEITANALRMGSCNKCTLENKLNPAQKQAIGVPV